MLLAMTFVVCYTAVIEMKNYNLFHHIADRATADHQIAVVEHHGLAGGQSALGFVEHHPGEAVFLGVDGGGLGLNKFLID